MCIGSALSSTLQFAERHASLRPLPASIIRPIFIIFASRRPIDTYNHSPALIVIALSYIWTGCSWFHFFADADSWNRSLDASDRPDSIFGSPAALGSARALGISLYEWRHRNFPLPGPRNSHVPGGSLSSTLLCARTVLTSSRPFIDQLITHSLQLTGILWHLLPIILTIKLTSRQLNEHWQYMYYNFFTMTLNISSLENESAQFVV